MGDAVVRLLQDGKPCELDMPKVDIAWWYIQRTGGWDDEFVSDERLEFLLKYFDSVEVDNDESTDGN